MVTTECNNSWQCLPCQRGPLLLRVRRRLAAQDQVVAFLDLLDGIRVVVPVFERLTQATDGKHQ